MNHVARQPRHRTGGPATLADVAGAAGVSASTASKVVRDLPGISGELRRRVLQAVEALDYRPHPAGRALRPGAATTVEPVTIAVPTLMNGYYRRLTGHLARTARTSGLHSRIVQTEGSQEVEADLLAASRRQGSPLLLASVHLHPEPCRGRSAARPTPAVLLADLEVAADLDRVGVDSAGAADLCTTHLLDAGRRRLALVGAGGRGALAGAALRERGFLEATRRRGVHVPPARRLPLPRWTAEHGAVATTVLLEGDRTVDGIVVANDRAATGVLHALRAHGRRVPDDVAVTGVDDDDVARGSAPALTSVALPVTEMSEAAVLLLLERVAGCDAPARVQQFSGRLVVRSSSRT